MFDFMPFSPNQVAAVRALDWLLDIDTEYRRTGRTYVWATALIRQALRHPGQRVAYCDHTIACGVISGRADLNTMVRALVEGLVYDHPELDQMSWEFQQRSFTLVGWGSLSEGPSRLDWFPQMNGEWDDVDLHTPEEEEPEAPEPGPPAPTCWERLSAKEEVDDPFD